MSAKYFNEMKLLTNTYRDKKYLFICLENKQDADVYSKVNAEIKSHQAVNFWMGFKSQTFHASPSDYYAHEEPADNIMGAALSLKMSLAQKPVSIIDYCNDSDSIINYMNSRIYQYLNRGDMVRINSAGGYCPIQSLEEYETISDISEMEMFNLLLHKDITYTFEITGNSLVIENDKHIPNDLILSFCKKSGFKESEIQIFNSFKHRTVLFKDNDFIRLFKNGVKQGLVNICFETTGQDVPQINKLKTVLEYVMTLFPNKTLTVWCKLYEKYRKLITTKSDNIKIEFI